MTSLKARLTKARARLFGTAAKDIVVPFTLSCDCGNQVTGIRRSSYQIATCTACDARIYVLPVNVYPATQRIRSEVLDGSVTHRLSIIVRDLAFGENEPETDDQPPTKSKSAGQRRSATRIASEPNPSEADSSDIIDVSTGRSRRSDNSRKLSRTAAALVAEQILVEEPVVRVPRRSIAVTMRRVFTPFKLLMLSAIFLIGVTAWWIVTQRRMDDARKTWRQETDAAERALEREDLAALHDSLSKAVAAAETLHRDDPDSRRANSLLMQTRAVQGLSSADLISILTGCAANNGKLSPEKVTLAGDTLKDNWFVFECSLQPASTGLTTNLPLFVHSSPVTISIDSDLLARAVSALPQSPLMFAACVESCSLVDGGRQFHIQLNGKTPTLITTQFHAEQLGFTTTNTPGLVALLSRQSEFLKTDLASAEGEQQ